PWALALMKSRQTMAGPNATFDSRGNNLATRETSDPVEECVPHGTPRILTWPAKFQFLQTPDVVYILYEYGPYWRPVWLNKQHPVPDELDSTLWGHSIGHYEGTDTLGADAIGFNDETVR